MVVDGINVTLEHAWLVVLSLYEGIGEVMGVIRRMDWYWYAIALVVSLVATTMATVMYQ